MPKFHLSIHVDQHGLQTINSDGDPGLWPLVGRLARAAGEPPPLISVTMSGAASPAQLGADDAAELAWFSSFWARTTERACIVGSPLGERRFAVLNSDDPRLSGHAVLCDLVRERLRLPASTSMAEVLTKADAALARAELSREMSLNSSGADLATVAALHQRIAEIAELMQPRIARLNERDSDEPPLSLVDAVRGLLADQEIAIEQAADLKAIHAAAAPLYGRLSLPATTSTAEALRKADAALGGSLWAVDRIERRDAEFALIEEAMEPLRADLSIATGSIPEALKIVHAELQDTRAIDAEIRGILEEAIGRTPDPARSTTQLALDLVSVLKAAIAQR